MKAIPPRPGLPSALHGLPEASTPVAGGAGGKGRRRQRTTVGDTRPRVARGSARAAGTACKGGVGVQVAWLGVAGVTGRARRARAGGCRGRASSGAALGGARAGELVTVWFTPHIRTLRIGSLARNSFTFWHTKCFFLVLVLLALSGATATAVVLVQLDDMPGAAAAAAAAKGGAAETAHKPAAPGLPRTDPHPRSLSAPWSRPSRYLPTPPRWFRPPHAPPPPPRPREPAGPRRTPPPGAATALPSPGPRLPAWVVPPVPGRQRLPRPPLLPGPDRNRARLCAPRSPARKRGGAGAGKGSLSTAGGPPCPGPSQPGFGSFPQPDVPRWRRRHCSGGEEGRECEEGGTYHPHPGGERRNAAREKGSPAGKTKERPLAPPERGSSHSPGPRARSTRGTRPSPPGPMGGAGREPRVL